MGLDMYLTGDKFLWTNWEDVTQNRIEDGFQISNIKLRIGYWRKHPNLHGYIVKTFAGGKDECQRIDLDVDDLNNIITAVKAGDLPYTEGFFFGKSEGTSEESAEDVSILEAAIAWIKGRAKNESRSVFYKASW